MRTDNIVRSLRAMGGVARFAEIGASRWDLARAVTAGRIAQHGRGVYALADAPRELVVAVDLNATLSCVSALRAHGVDVPGPRDVVHCTVPRSRGHARHRQGTRLHYGTPSRSGGTRIASLVDAVATVPWCLPYEDTVAALDQVLRAPGAPAPEELLTAVARRSAGMARALAIDLDPRARAHTESRIRLALRRAGLAVRPGALVPTVGEVDLLVAGRIIVELDGMAYHAGREQFRQDRRRDRRALALGFLTLRFAWEDCREELVVASVLAVLEMLGDVVLAPYPEIPSDLVERLARLRELAARPEHALVGQSPRRPR